MSDLYRSPLVQAVLFAHQSPPEGLRKLAQLVRAARAAGDRETEHVLADNFVTLATKSRIRLGTAEQFARRLVAQQPDKHHLLNLAMVLVARGKVGEAASLRRKASRARDEHTTPEIEEAIREAEDEARHR